MVVDDDLAMRTLLDHYLAQLRYRVILMADGNSALDCVKSGAETPDLLLSDLHLAGISGFDLVLGLRKSRWAGPVILMTGYSLDEFNLPPEVKVDAILKKPIRLGELGEWIKKLLGE
jgi:CheY-like chemotaxis protein